MKSLIKRWSKVLAHCFPEKDKEIDIYRQHILTMWMPCLPQVLFPFILMFSPTQFKNKIFSLTIQKDFSVTPNYKHTKLFFHLALYFITPFLDNFVLKGWGGDGHGQQYRGEGGKVQLGGLWYTFIAPDFGRPTAWPKKAVNIICMYVCWFRESIEVWFTCVF